MKLFAAKTIKVSFYNNEAMFMFEDCPAVHDCIENDVRKCEKVTTVIGYDDGHVEVEYPIKWNKVSEFKRHIKTFNYYAENFELPHRANLLG